MLNKFKFRLDLFGEGSGAAPSGATGGNAAAGSPSADATKTGVEGAVAEPKANTAAEGNPPAVEKTREERRKAYDAFIKGEGKEFFEEDTQNIISKRVKDGKALKEQVEKYKPFIDALTDRYNHDPDDLDGLMKAIQADRDFCSEAAAEAGMDNTETYLKFKDHERKAKLYEAEQKKAREAATEAERKAFADRQVNKWEKQAENLKAKYPGFDLRELSNPLFAATIGFFETNRVENAVEMAYHSLHHSDILKSAVETAKADTEKAVVDNIRAKGNRPVEGGASSSSATSVGYDVKNLTREQRAEIARQAAFGKRIDLK